MARIQIKNLHTDEIKVGDTTVPAGSVTEIDIDDVDGLHITSPTAKTPDAQKLQSDEVSADGTYEDDDLISEYDMRTLGYSEDEIQSILADRGAPYVGPAKSNDVQLPNDGAPVTGAVDAQGVADANNRLAGDTSGTVNKGQVPDGSVGTNDGMQNNTVAAPSSGSQGDSSQGHGSDQQN